MRNIFLLMKYYIGEGNDYKFPKFDYQIEALKSMGFEVYFLGFKSNEIYLCNNSKTELVLKYNNHILSRLSLYHALYKAAQIVFTTKINFECAYIRSMPLTPAYYRLLKKIKSNYCKIIVEIPTFPIEKEIITEKSFLRKKYFFLSLKFLMKISYLVDLFVLIGQESSYFASRPAVNIENGISLKKIPIRTPIKNSDNELHILGLANMARWHGYDRVIKGIKEYYDKGGTFHVFFHLIGSDSDGSLQQWKLLAKELNLSDSIFFEGPKYGEELDYYFNICEVAIGSIGLHRIGFEGAATLKIREYISRGIPFVISANDLSKALPSNFYVKTEANDKPLDINSVILFLESTNSSGLEQSMRSYAENNLTWNRQFEKIFNKITDLDLN